MAYAGGTAKWVVRDGILWSRVTGGSGADLILNLSDYTVQELREYLEAIPGYSVPAYNTEHDDLSARIIMDSSGQCGGSVTSEFRGYTGLAWGILDTFAQWLKLAESDIDRLPDEADLTTAGGTWLDNLAGEVYGFPRIGTETDRDYAARTVREILQPRNNNIAIGEAIRRTLQISQPVSVVDVVPPETGTFPNRRDTMGILYDGRYLHGPRTHTYYCQFDVQTNFDLVASPDPSELFAQISEVVKGFRAAGTRLRAFAAEGTLSDIARRPRETVGTIALSPTFAEDTRGPMHDGTHMRDDGTVFGRANDLFNTASLGIGLSDAHPVAATDTGGGLTITRAGVPTEEAF